MRILISPLDWGLGHATRCIPLVRYLAGKHCEMIIGASGRPLYLLKKEFPGLEFLEMPGYDISYPASSSMTMKMAVQIPKIVSGIRREHGQLKKIIREKKIDAVISDNRFGLWSREVPCVFITHQVMVKSPVGEKWIHALNKRYMKRFTECWIPDQPGENGLSGDLAHRFPLPGNAKYIGWLSRFAGEKETTPDGSDKKWDLLVILSGPEPQRTIFEKMVMEQLPLVGRVLIVRGITEKEERKQLATNVEAVSYLGSEELLNEMQHARWILSRPGYSTLMDLAVLGKKALFVPTPGQTEQEYLAQQMMNAGIAYAVPQKNFNLQQALAESTKYAGFKETGGGEDFKEVVNGFLDRLRERRFF